MPERATTETNEDVPLKTLEELWANRIGWSNSAVSPFAVDCRNRQQYPHETDTCPPSSTPARRTATGRMTSRQLG
jgi:hypothetical protein